MPDHKRTRFRVLRAYWLVGVLVLGWLGIVWLRQPIRAMWWELRLRHANSVAEQLYYMSLLSSVGPTALAAARSLLADSDPAMRSLGVGILSRVSDESAPELLRGAVDDSAIEVSRMAAIELARRQDPSALAPLERLVACGSERDALQAVSAYASFECEVVAENLCSIARTHPAAAIRAQAIEQLGYKRCRQAVAVLIEALADGESYNASTVLDQMDQKALDLLAARQIERREATVWARDFAAVSDVAAFALRLLSGQSFGFQSADPPARRRAAQQAWRDWWAGEQPE